MELKNNTINELTNYLNKDNDNNLFIIFEFKIINNTLPLIVDIKIKEKYIKEINNYIKVKPLFNKLYNNDSLGKIVIDILKDNYIYKARFFNNDNKVMKDVFGYFDTIFNDEYLNSLLHMLQFNLIQYNQFNNIYDLYNKYKEDINNSSLMLITPDKQFEFQFINNDKMVYLLELLKETIYEDKIYDILLKIQLKNNSTIELYKELGGFYNLIVTKNYKTFKIYYGLPKINREDYETKFKNSFEFCLNIKE